MTDGEQAEVVFSGVTVRRGARVVLSGFDLTVRPGEVLALVGRSGAGKSTILKLINRMLVPDAGEVRVAGRPAAEWDRFELRRRVGYVLQEVALFPHLNVSENVAVVPRLLGWPEARIAERVRELLTLAELDPGEFAGRRPDQLSGGQRQRVGVARALGGDPPILLMDEPFGALDPMTRADLHRGFLRLQRRLRKTVVIVTHDMGEAFALADRIGVLADGALAALDAPPEMARSQDARVRGLLQPLVEAAEALRGASA